MKEETIATNSNMAPLMMVKLSMFVIDIIFLESLLKLFSPT